ncbi:MAG TPA: XdhC family protein [Silvibacterium sp.]|jgi:xanthine dehydrogenase accessory factor|nr:XdhC family protein [Silvibacterium sp.]
MFSDLYCKAAELASEGKSFVIATVVRVEGSSSARRGSKAIIDPLGRLLLGWVGGGCAESAVRSEALKCLETRKPRLITVDMTDEQLGVGMPCGGTMDIFIEPVLPKPELLIVGHGRIAETLSTLGHLMGFAVTVNDPAADRDSFPQAEKLVTEDFDLTETPIGPGSFVVIATQHKRDHLWLQKALEGNAAYVALIASRHRAALVLDYLRAAGVSEDKIATISAPAGLDLGASTPEEIALSVMSQMVALRRGGTVSPLHLKEAGLPNHTLAADAVIRQCETDDIP